MISIDGKTRIVGLLGWPVSHSHSPAMHNAAFAALGLNWAYIPLPISPDSIKSATQSLQTFQFVGANVTIPHKQAIIRQLDEINPAAQTIGAVNTVLVKEGRFLGYNTDSYGFLASLKEGGFDPHGSRCLVLGAGGAARAVVYSLAQAGASLVAVYNRTVERAAFLVDDLSADFPHVHLESRQLSPEILGQAQNSFDIVVNTTSLGMTPNPDTSPWPDDIPLPQAIICDLVYNPLETHFLKQAKSAGLPTIDGVGMLVHQGARAFEIWTGQHPPTDIMRQTVLNRLHQKQESKR